MFNPVINEVLVLIKIVEKELNALIRQRCYRELTSCQSTAQTGICGTVLTVQYLPSGEEKKL